jgi:hypothetical protein
MGGNRYNVSYGSALRVKDRPHRALDTARGIPDSPQHEETIEEQSLIIGEYEVADAIEIVEPEVAEVDPQGTT